MKQFLAFILSVLLCLPSGATTIRVSNGSRSDVQAKIDACVDDDIVTMPFGTFTWSSSVDMAGKGISLLGGGSGFVAGIATDNISIGTGSKSFTTDAGLPWQAGDAITAFFTENGNSIDPAHGTNMQGTVTSYNSGTGALVINSVTANGSGTYASWTFYHDVAAVQTHVIITGGTANGINFTEDASHYGEIGNIFFESTSALTSGHIIQVNHTSGGKPLLIHDCRFTTLGGGTIRAESNSGVTWSNHFDCALLGPAGNGSGHSPDFGCFQFKPAGLSSSWTTADTLGQNDTDGFGNFYVEDSSFNLIKLQSFDFDEMGRAVLRHSLFNNSGGTSHGRDTGIGTRHWQIYKCRFVFHDIGLQSISTDYYIFLRGGTGIIASNSFVKMISSQWGDKTEVKMTVQALQRSCGNDCCWNAGWPQPRQIGQSYDAMTMMNFNDPAYFWENTGFMEIGLDDYGCDQANSCPMCASQPLVTEYLQLDRDYKLSARPGWQPYTYPHPARSQVRSLTGGGPGPGPGNPGVGTITTTGRNAKEAATIMRR